LFSFDGTIRIKGIVFERGEKMQIAQLKFDKLLIEAIDEVLSSLGEPVKNHLYVRLEDDFSITRNDIPRQMEEFSSFLFRIFGSSAQHLEIKLMKTLYAKISADQHFEHNPIAFKRVDLTFLTYVNRMRESFEISRF
jgi:hypothetical protein